MRHAGQAVKLDVVFERQLAQLALGLAAQVGHAIKRVRELTDSSARLAQQRAHDGVTLGVNVRCTAFFNLVEAVLQRFHQQLAAFGVVQQVVLQIGVALHHPDVTQHFIQHAGRAACAALATQLVQLVPRGLAQQPDDHLAVRKRGVVVRNLANAGFTLRRVQRK